MKYTIVLHSSPESLSGSTSALKFARSLISAGHCIYRVFLHGDAVLLSCSNTVASQDEMSIHNEWKQFIIENKLDAIVCISSAIKRGVMNTDEASRYDKLPTMSPCYTLSGLGQLVDACVGSDRVITFK